MLAVEISDAKQSLSCVMDGIDETVCDTKFGARCEKLRERLTKFGQRIDGCNADEKK